MMKNSMEVSLFELSEDGSSLFSSEECYGTNGNEDEDDDADGEEFSDKLIGEELTFDQQRLVAAQVPAFISTDSLDYSSLSIGEEQLTAACATNKREYVLTFDKNAFESGLAILSTLDVDSDKIISDNNENNNVYDKEKCYERKNMTDLPTNFEQLKENKNQEDFNNANIIQNQPAHPCPNSDQDNLNDNEDNDELMTWERVKRSYEITPNSFNSDNQLYNLPNSKCTSLPNLQPTLAPHQLIRNGAEEKMVSAEMCHHFDNNSDQNYNNIEQNSCQKRISLDNNQAPFSLLKAFQQNNNELFSHVTQQPLNHVTQQPLNHVTTVSNESSGYVTGTGGSQIVGNVNISNMLNNYYNNSNNNNRGTNFNNNCTKYDSNEIVNNFHLHHQNVNKIANNSLNDKKFDEKNSTVTANIDECTNQIFQQLMKNHNFNKSTTNNTNDDQDYEYAEFFINGRYIDMNHNEIGFVPPPETPRDAQNGHVTNENPLQTVQNEQIRDADDRQRNLPNFGQTANAGAFYPVNNGRRCWQTNFNRTEIPPAKPPRTFATLLEQNNENADDNNFAPEIIDSFAQYRKNRYLNNQQNYNGNCVIDSHVTNPYGQYNSNNGYSANAPPKDSATQIPVYVADQSVQTVLPDNGRLVTVINQSSADWSSDSAGPLSPTNQQFSRHRLPDLSFLRFPFKVPPLDVSLSPFLMNFLGESPQSPPPLLSRDFGATSRKYDGGGVGGGFQQNSFLSNLMKLKNLNTNIFNYSNFSSQLLQQLPSPPPKLAAAAAATQKLPAALNNAAFSTSRDAGPSHVQDWDSLATLLPKDVVQACLFFKENTNYLRNIDKPPPQVSAASCLNPDRKFHYFPSCKKSAHARCKCKPGSNSRRCDRIEESDEESTNRNHVTGLPTGPGHFYYCCYHCDGASIAANAGCPAISTFCAPAWCHPRFKQTTAAHSCGGSFNNDDHHCLAHCQQHCDNNRSTSSAGCCCGCCSCSSHSEPVCRLVGGQSRDALSSSRNMSQSTYCSLPSSDRRTKCACHQKASKNNGKRSNSKLKDAKIDLDPKDEIEFGNSVKSLTVLIEKITRYCSDVVEAFAQSANKADGYNLNAVVGAVLFDSLCPAVENLVSDGLSTGKTVLNIVQTSVTADFAAQSVCSLVIGLNSTGSKRRENSLQFAVFINSLLNLHSLDVWLTDLINNETLLLENYAPFAFLRIIGSKRCINLYDSMMGAVKRLTVLPFERLKLIDVQISISSNEHEEEEEHQNIDNDVKNLGAFSHCAFYARTPSSETDDQNRKGFSCNVALQKELRIIFRFPSSYTASTFLTAASNIFKVENSTKKLSSEFIFDTAPSLKSLQSPKRETVPAKLASDSRIPTNSSSVLSKFKNSFDNEKSEKVMENEGKIETAPLIVSPNVTTPKSIPGVDSALKKSTKPTKTTTMTTTPMTPPQTPKKSRIPLPRSASAKPKSDVFRKDTE